MILSLRIQACRTPKGDITGYQVVYTRKNKTYAETFRDPSPDAARKAASDRVQELLATRLPS